MYRIKTITHGNGEVHHLIQRKGLLFGWNTVEDSYTECPLVYSTIEAAKAAINEWIAEKQAQVVTSITYTNHP